MQTKPVKYRAPALDKGLDILELLARTRGPLNMTAIAAAIGYSKGEIFRMLQVLEERGFIARERDGGFALTDRLFLLGMEQPPVKSLVEAALPAMHRLAGQVMQPCHLVVASGDQVVVIARVESPGGLGFVVRIGHHQPLARSASGAVLFAFQGDDVREEWLQRMRAAGTLRGRKRFIAQADAIRARGYAVLPSGDVKAVTDLAAPILRHGAAAGALTIPHVDRRPSRVAIAAAVERLREAVANVARELTTWAQ